MTRAARGFRMRLPATQVGRERAAERFERFAAEERISPRACTDVLIVLDEILANIGRHAWKKAAGKRIVFAAKAEAGVLELRFIDDGRPFDVLGRPDPDTAAPLELRPVGGLGILLVKRLTDAQSYERVRGRNRLVLRKRIGRSGESPAR